MQYNTSINTSGFGPEIPGQIAKLRSPAKQSLMTSLFNLPPYAQARVNPQQRQEMDRNFTHTQRAASWDKANELERDYDAANQRTRFGQLGAATNQAGNFFDIGNGAAANQRQIGLEGGLDTLGFVGSLMRGNPLLQSLFSGGF